MLDITKDFKQNKTLNWEHAVPFFPSISHLPNYYLNKWLKVTDNEADNLLKTQQFLYQFQEYIKSMINYEVFLRKLSNGNNNYYHLSFVRNLDKTMDMVQEYFNKELIHFILNEQTPHSVELQQDAFRLLKYNNQTNNNTFSDFKLRVNSQQQKQKENQQDNKASLQLTPILMVYAPINRYHILDINQKRSIVKQFLSKGFDVFLIDWGSQKEERIDDHNNNNKNQKLMEDYISFIDKSIQEIKELTKSNTINLYGYSWGGLLCLLYSCYKYLNKNIKNLILHSSPLDFSKDNTIIAEWLRRFPKDEYIKQYKEMHGNLIDTSFLMRNPFKHNFDDLRYALAMQVDNITSKNDNKNDNKTIEKYQNIDLFQLIIDTLRIRTWITNTPDLPGELFKQFIHYFYCQNAIIQNYNINKSQSSANSVNDKKTTDTNSATVIDENLNVDNNKENLSFPSIEKIIAEIDIAKINMPTLSIVGKNDDLISYDSSISLNNYISNADKHLIEFPGDHIELCISEKAHLEIWPKVVKWLEQRSF